MLPKTFYFFKYKNLVKCFLKNLSNFNPLVILAILNDKSKFATYIREIIETNKDSMKIEKSSSNLTIAIGKVVLIKRIKPESA